MGNTTLITEESTVIGATEIYENIALPSITALQSMQVDLLPRDIRIDKVVGIRRQLAEGRYDINERLGVVIDRLLEGFIL